MFRKIAMENYRYLWRSYLAIWGTDETSRWQRAVLTEMMDEMQPYIADGPTQEWFDFTATLPGYDAYWSNPASWAHLHGGGER